jgi:hypothetical protein
MFLLNSRYPLFIETCTVPFIPKLQGYFAEFLQHCCLLCLNLLNLFTCVRVSTAQPMLHNKHGRYHFFPDPILFYCIDLRIKNCFYKIYYTI